MHDNSKQDEGLMMDNDNVRDSLSPEQVLQFLRDNPTFFLNHEDLLADMFLPHVSGNAVSLIERQVSVLRERNMEMRHRLTRLLENARDNDRLFDKTRKLVLQLLDATSLEAISDTVHDSLVNDFGVGFAQLTLLGDRRKPGVRVVTTQQAMREIGSILKNSRAVCGALRPEEFEFLFPDDYRHVGSAAVVPLSDGSHIGVLAIGNRDPNYYRSSMGTLFLSYVAEVLNRVLPRLTNF